MTVSYTHLDVYKRQVFLLACASNSPDASYNQAIAFSFMVALTFAELFLNCTDILTTSVLPVSYTHLDVYKRQVQHDYGCALSY